MGILDEFEHEKERKNYVRRDSDRSYKYPTNAQFKFTHFDECHKKYFDAQYDDDTGQTNEIMMDTERGCNIYLWRLEFVGKVLEHRLVCQWHHYRMEAAACWCPDSRYFFVTSHGRNIDLIQVSNGQIVCTLPSNGNLFTDLRLSHHGFRLCVTMNSRDV